jgi:hypothetical protein
MTDQATTDRLVAFMTADFPRDQELQEILRELKQRNSRANTLQADWVWRLRRGETVDMARICALFPFLTARPKYLQRWVHELLMWDVLATTTPTLTLTERAS